MSFERTGGYDFERKPHRPLSEVVGHAIGVYVNLKMAVLGYQAARRAFERGATTQEAIKTGAAAAGAWIMFVGFTLMYPFMFSEVLLQPVFYYATIEQPIQSQSALFMWSVTILAGVPALAVQVVVWLILYSRLSDKLASKMGRLYRWGFRLRRRFFRAAPWWKLVLLVLFSLAPMNILVNL